MLDLSDLRSAVRHEGGVSRRLFLAYGVALAALPLLADRVASAATRPATRAAFGGADPFTLGVASGDPEPAGMVLWTRLAPAPLEPGGGMPPVPVNVAWEVAEDDGMRKVVQRGTAVAAPDLGHAVHVEVDGLRPDRWYWYRFKAGDATSPIGRTRTAPPADATPGALNFAFASCQHYEAGLFTAYEHLAQDELDLVVHLGDYIYEGGPGAKPIRQHSGTRATHTLAEYRARHNQYRADPLLQAAHARCPWVVTWDDHEVANNYAGDVPSPPNRKIDHAAFLARRAAAYQAYYEAMPLRRACLPSGPNLTLYRTSRFGRLAEFQVLDTRQYRTDQPHDEKPSELDAAALEPKNTLLGRPQREWLQASLSKSTATWNVLAQQVMMGMVDRKPGPEHAYSMDQWGSAATERMELVKFLGDRKIANPVVLTGDIHSNWVNDLRPDDRRPEQPVVATEFVGTSISSGGNGVDHPKSLATTLAENPCVKYHNAERGYVRCTVTPGKWVSDYVAVEDVTKPGGRVVKRATFAVEAGRAGAVRG
ncbi:MAG: phosphodiesterase/alkaline phosphatase [Phycisphaerales bacterium]|nr:phosphodiesterase/alkaline phosphatase [Phycisphaerales bacterium]